MMGYRRRCLPLLCLFPFIFCGLNLKQKVTAVRSRSFVLRLSLSCSSSRPKEKSNQGLACGHFLPALAPIAVHRGFPRALYAGRR
uniref:Putative secreted protein n=1 Tax=Anopheles darlingi TaxID=43151 RepID=A0A2M4DHT8_ANODA